MIINSDQMKYTRKGCPNSHINTQYSPLWRQRRRVFSQANSHKGAKCRLEIDCTKHLAPVDAIRPFERGRIAGLREAEWTFRRIDAHVRNNVSVKCHSFKQWSVEHSHIRRPGSGRPRSTDARQDQRIPRAAVAARTEFEVEFRAHVAPGESPRTIGNCLLATGHRSLVPLDRLPLTPRHHTARLLWWRQRVDWRGTGALLYSVIRVGSVFMGVMDVHVYAVDLVTIIFRIEFAHNTQAPSQVSFCGGHQLQLAVTFVFL